MNLRSGRFRAAAAVPVAATLVVALAGCETHVGAAAIVDGKSISERSVSSYVKPTMKNLTYTSGQTVTPRTFVLQALLQEKVLTDILASSGTDTSDAALSATKTEALQGTAEADFLKQITSLGLPASLEPQLLRIQELAVLLAKKFTSEQDQQKQVSRFGRTVSVSPRYGQWNPDSLALTEPGTKQASPVVRYTTPLPGDVKPSAAP